MSVDRKLGVIEPQFIDADHIAAVAEAEDFAAGEESVAAGDYEVSRRRESCGEVDYESRQAVVGEEVEVVDEEIEAPLFELMAECV